MRLLLSLVCGLGLLFAVLPSARGADKTVGELIQEGKTAFDQGRFEAALKAANQAVELDGKNPQALMLRANVYERLDQHKEAVADYSKVIELDPKKANAFNRRGGEQFKLGKIKESLEDFDKFLELKPEATESHWQRGISLYYAGRYEDGRKQFELAKKISADDVENAVWCYICMAKTVGVDKARDALLKIEGDKRIPMMVVYELFRGKAKPEDVLTAAKEGKPAQDELTQRLFYAHLYLGLWYEAQGDKKKSLEHLAKAAEEFKVKGYMWDVARVHLEILRKDK
jgi:lipoprotein NlpI